MVSLGNDHARRTLSPGARNQRPAVAGSLQALPDPGGALPAVGHALCRGQCVTRRTCGARRRLALGQPELAPARPAAAGFHRSAQRIARAMDGTGEYTGPARRPGEIAHQREPAAAVWQPGVGTRNGPTDGPAEFDAHGGAAASQLTMEMGISPISGPPHFRPNLEMGISPISGPPFDLISTSIELSCFTGGFTQITRSDWRL